MTRGGETIATGVGDDRLRGAAAGQVDEGRADSSRDRRAICRVAELTEGAEGRVNTEQRSNGARTEGDCA